MTRRNCGSWRPGPKLTRQCAGGFRTSSRIAGAEAAALRADALVALGDVASASTTLAAVGDVDGAARLDLWSGQWNALTPATPTAWQKAAEFVGPSSTDPAARLLSRSGKAVEASLASRDAIEALLATVPSPSAD